MVEQQKIDKEASLRGLLRNNPDYKIPNKLSQNFYNCISSGVLHVRLGKIYRKDDAGVWRHYGNQYGPGVLAWLYKTSMITINEEGNVVWTDDYHQMVKLLKQVKLITN